MEDSSVIVLVFVVLSVFIVLMIASMWTIFTKVGQFGWAAIIPIYNAAVFMKIIGKPGWWFFKVFVKNRAFNHHKSLNYSLD